MQADRQVTSSTSLQIPPQPEFASLRNQHPILLDTIQPVPAQGVIDPKRGMEGSLPPQTSSPTRACSAPGHGKPCWSLDVRVAVLLVSVAGAVILLLLYRLLQLRHRLRLARARQPLEYYSFYHAATYTLKDPGLPLVLPAKNGNVSEVHVVTTPVTPTATDPALPPLPPALPPPPLLPVPPAPVLPHPPLHPPPSLTPPPPLPLTPPLVTLPHPLPVIHYTPPSPHLSWGASSDADVYSRIGAFRPSRLSSLSSHSQVILFEHSSL